MIFSWRQFILNNLWSTLNDRKHINLFRYKFCSNKLWLTSRGFRPQNLCTTRKNYAIVFKFQENNVGCRCILYFLLRFGRPVLWLSTMYSNNFVNQKVNYDFDQVNSKVFSNTEYSFFFVFYTQRSNIRYENFIVIFKCYKFCFNSCFFSQHNQRPFFSI